MKPFSKIIIRLAFIVAFLIAVAVTIFSFQSTSNLIKTENLVSHTYKVFSLLEMIFSELSHTQNSVLAYTISGDRSNLQEAERSKQSIKDMIGEFKSLTRLQELKHFSDSLNQHVVSYFSMLEPISIPKEKYSSVEHLRVKVSEDGQAHIDSIRYLIDRMELVINQALIERTDNSLIAVNKTYLTLILTGILTLIILFGAVYLTIQYDNYESELIKAKELAEESVRAKQQFLANMSHEIRTPMNAVIGLTSVLLKDNLNPKQRECLDAIKNSGDTLLVILNDILDISKIESGKMSLEKVRFNFHDLMKSTTKLFESKIEEKGISYSVEVDSDIPAKLVGDPIRINQILMNLIGNAVKFTSEGKISLNVKLLSRNERETVTEFNVSDTGIGIPKEKIEYIFEGFTQVHEGTYRQYGGTGLGLNIVDKLVKLHNGKIFVESTIGAGSLFRFTIPFENAEMEEGETIHSSLLEPAEYTGKLKSIKVMVVEDNNINLLLAETVLGNYGIDVIPAENGREALQKLEQFSVDLILMDLQMPIMDGFEATDFIRKNMKKSKSELPIIALTANVVREEMDRCLAIGMNDFIMKPFTEDHLMQKILLYLNLQHKLPEIPVSEMNEPETAGIEINSVPKNTHWTNLDNLKSISRGSNEFMTKMINMFLDQTPDAITSLKAEIKSRNWENIRSNAHKMRGPIGLMGIKALEQNLKQIELHAAAKENYEEISNLVEHFEKSCTEVYAELKSELDNMS